MWRVIRTHVSGQYANDDCFLKWIGAYPAQIAIARVVLLPAIGGTVSNANDQKLYIVYQAAEVPTPNCANGNPELVTRNGLNGWATQAEADAVANGDLEQRNKIAAQVKAQNDAAVAPGKILGDAAKELADDAGAAAKSSWPWLVPVGIGVGAFIAWKILK